MSSGPKGSAPSLWFTLYEATRSLLIPPFSVLNGIRGGGGGGVIRVSIAGYHD